MNKSVETNCLAIPEILQHLNTVAVALLSHDGNLLDANEHFLNLLNVTGPNKNVKQFFIEPKFEYLANTYPASHCQNIIFNGIVTLGDSGQKTDALRVAVFRFQNKILLIGEQDIDSSIRLRATAIELDHAIAYEQKPSTKPNDQVRQDEAIISYLTHTDPLTGIGNRQYFVDRAAVEIARSQRHNSQLALISIGIDQFKKINDTYGYDTGDKILKNIAQTVAQPVRRIDIVARTGGEKFLVLLSEIALNQAVLAAERIKSALTTQTWEPIDWKVTASFGVIAINNENSIDDLIQQAETVMSQSQRDGGNRITVG